MIRIKGRGAVYGEVWYQEEAPRGRCDVDIVVYRHRETAIASARPIPLLSLVTDLGPDEEVLLRQFAQTCRQNIRQAETKDKLQFEVIASPRGRLGEFCEFYDAFARQKSLAPSDRQWLDAVCRAHQLSLALVHRDGEPLVWHAHLLSGKTVGLQFSASCFRNREDEYRALIGRANRWLHWQEMLWFKQQGMERYDWGGLFVDDSTPERAGINGFKRSFGGRLEHTYDYAVPVTLRGRIYLPLRDAWRRWAGPAAGA